MKSSTISSFLSKILSFLKSRFSKVFQINIFGKPREYSSTIVFADKGYDSSKLIDSADKLEIFLICPINKCNTKKLKVSNISKSRFRNYEFLSFPTGKKFYKKRRKI